MAGDSGTVRGEAIRHGFLWQQGAMQDIGGGAGSLSISFAYGINAAGEVAGVFDGRASLWQNSGRQDLGTLPGHTASAARGINASGQVVGESGTPPSQSRAFVWHAGVMQDLGTLPGDVSSQATAVNAAGLVVGWSRSASAASRAVLWRVGVASDLNAALPAGSGWVLTSATGINDAGQIAGVGLHDGQTRAFLMTPVAPGAPSSLASAVLPGSRSVQVGRAATAFATLINGGSDTLTDCAIAPLTALRATFVFQTTDPITNAVSGSANQPVNLAAGASQSFVIALTPSAAIAPIDVAFSFSCANTPPAPVTPGLNTLLLSASTAPVPDIVALAATIAGDGTVAIPAGGAGTFAVATVNPGAGGLVTMSADTGLTSLPVGIALCQTDPVTSQCTSPLGPAVPAPIDAGATPTFAVFVTATAPIAFSPASHRIFVRFKDADGIVRGATSVAVRTE